METNWPVSRVDAPNWTTTPIIAASVMLALLVLAAALWQARRAADGDGDDAAAAAQPTQRGLDAMLLFSALAIVGLAAAVYLTRP